MMRRLLPALLAVAIVGVFAWTLVFLYDKSKVKPVVYKTTTAEVRDLVQKTVAAGATSSRACPASSSIWPWRPGSS
jgi:HlyD family secretion protein